MTDPSNKKSKSQLGKKEDSPINKFELRSLGSQAAQRSAQTVAENSSK